MILLSLFFLIFLFFGLKLLCLQILLTGEPGLVASACSLLQKALRHNGDALPRLYQTGLFFFALAYCGSNLLEMAALFQVLLFWFLLFKHNVM